MTEKCMGACKSRTTTDVWWEAVTIPWLPLPYIVLHDGDVCKREERDG